MPIELLTSPGCPNAKAATKVVTDCLTTLGIDVPIIDRVGRYPSPTVLVDGVDVMRPEAAAPIGDTCRLDMPTPQRVLDARRREPPRWRNRRVDRPRLGGELEAAMHEGDRHAALTDGCCYALDRSGADIADGEDSRGARFEREWFAIGLPL
jgi:hypothetical protein